MTRPIAFAVLAAALVAASAAAQAPAGGGWQTDVTGVWTMLVEGHQIGLELEQKDTKVEGVMLAMGRRLLLVGTYEGRTLTLKGERPEDGAGATHGEPAEDAPGPIVATMKDDGTLEGELSTNRGRTKWTGERLKTPRPSRRAVTGEPSVRSCPSTAAARSSATARR